MFNHKRLSLARMRRRLTAKALAEKAKLAPDTIYRLEKRLHTPDDDTVGRLAAALNYPVEFFHGDNPPEVNTDAVSFRQLL